jgi:hypothetical protein
MNVFITIFVVCLPAIFSGCTQQQSDRQKVQPSAAVVVNASAESLVALLVSPVPAKYPSGESLRADGPEDINGYIHPQVEHARQQLVAMGTAIYPTLAEHVHDDRYSYSGVYAAWVNNSVGTMIKDIMADGIEPHIGGYKWRKNSTGSNGQPDFELMAKEFGGFEKYAERAKQLSKAELRREYVQWHIAKERGYGFTDSEQESKVLNPYLKLLKGD